MKAHYRGATAVLTALSLLINMGSGTIAVATADARIPVATQTLDMFDKAGNVTQHFEGTELLSSIARTGVAFRGFDFEVVRNLRASLTKYSKVSKRGIESVDMLLTILRAIEAPTADEYHSIIAELPIVIRKEFAQDA